MNEIRGILHSKDQDGRHLQEATVNAIQGFLHSKDQDGRHLQEAMVNATLIKKLRDNDYIVELADGTLCHALFNFFCCTWFIDDIYGVVEKGE